MFAHLTCPPSFHAFDLHVHVRLRLTTVAFVVLKLTVVLWGADSPTPQDSIYVHLSQESTPCKAVRPFISKSTSDSASALSTKWNQGADTGFSEGYNMACKVSESTILCLHEPLLQCLLQKSRLE